MAGSRLPGPMGLEPKGAGASSRRPGPSGQGAAIPGIFYISEAAGWLFRSSGGLAGLSPRPVRYALGAARARQIDVGFLAIEPGVSSAWTSHTATTPRSPPSPRSVSILA